MDKSAAIRAALFMRRGYRGLHGGSIMRIKNVMRNSFFGLLGQIVLILIGFVSQRVLNLKLGEALVGLNGVVSNIIAILSVSELGISTAVVYNLYQALADGAEETIAGLMNLYRRAYNVFAAVIMGLGLLIMPFVHLLLKDNPFTVGYVRLIYLLWLVRTTLSYLLSFRRSILIADQQEYIVSIVTLLVNVLNYSAVIFLVEYTGNYALALFVNIAVEAASNLWLTCYVWKKYPYLRILRGKPLKKELKQNVFANIRNIFVVRLANKLLVSTDNVIISGFIGVAFAGLYNNYTLITNSLTNLALALSNAIQPSVGAMFVEKDYRKDERMLRLVTFLFFLFGASAGCGVYAAVNPFVGDFWLADGYVLGMDVVGACVLNFYVLILSLPVGMVMGVTGLFEKERNIAVVSALCNMLLSLLTVKRWGIFGVLAGTLAAYVLQMSYRIFVFYRRYLNSPMKKYLLELTGYGLLGCMEVALVRLLGTYVYVPGNSLRFALLVMLSGGLPLLLNLAVYGRSDRMKSIAALVSARRREC